MASLIRSVSSHFGNPTKTADIQLAQAIEQFETEKTKLQRFKREFGKFLEAIVVFDNATFRFYEAIRSFDSSTWEESASFEQLNVEVRNTRNERLQALKNEINTHLSLTNVKFEGMTKRILLQSETEQEYRKVQRQYQNSLRDNPAKIDRLQREMNQLKSSLRELNKTLNGDIPEFQRDIRSDYRDIILETLDIEGKSYKKFYKICSRFVKKSKKSSKQRSDPDSDGNVLDEAEPLPSKQNGKSKKPENNPAPTPSKHRKFRILYSAQVKQTYKAVNPDEISIEKGEKVSIIEYEHSDVYDRDEGWEYAQKEDGTIGLIPMNFVTQLFKTEEPSATDTY